MTWKKKRGGRRSNQQNSERNSELENGEKGESRAAVLRCKRENFAIFFDTFYLFENRPSFGETQQF